MQAHVESVITVRDQNTMVEERDYRISLDDNDMAEPSQAFTRFVSNLGVATATMIGALTLAAIAQEARKRASAASAS